MVTPRAQKEMVLNFDNKNDFAEAFSVKYSGEMPFVIMASRINGLWQNRAKYVEEIARLKAEEEGVSLEATKQEQERNHTVMIPARIISKHSPSRDAVPDVGELLIRTNNLLAEMVQLQKEQIALFREIQGGKK